jgi:hypothetical protein
MSDGPRRGVFDVADCGPVLRAVLFAADRRRAHESTGAVGTGRHRADAPAPGQGLQP